MSFPLYTKYARYYDVIYKEYRKNVPRIIDFLIDVFKEDALRDVKDVLDIACGTGEPTIELAKRGYNVVGLDLNIEMIKIAEEKALKEGVKIEFKVGDMREMKFRNCFDAITCLFTSINYNLTDEDIKDT